MCPPSLLELCAYFERRIEGRERTLQYQRNRAAAQRAQFALRERQQVGALKCDGAFDLSMLLVEKTEDRHGQGALARTALSHETHYFAGENFTLEVTKRCFFARRATRE